MSFHEPVLKKESIEFLVSAKEGNYFEGTAGFGGHTIEILNKLGKNSRLVATDKDKIAFDYCVERFAGDERVKLYHTGFNNIKTISKIEFIDSYDGIFADLGVSSFQLDDKESGFTFRENAPLDLRMDKNSGVPASEVINTIGEEELANIFFNYGEERLSRRIAKMVSNERAKKRIATTFDLREIVESCVPAKHATKSLARIFQALRIYVNNELEDLRSFLKDAVELLAPNGVIVILTYHSLEDRIVKEHFKYEALDCICPPQMPICNCKKEKRVEIITRKPVTPSQEEIDFNPRSRSAKLRAAKRI
ncbi:MAG: 16S rRNA (cytosine(1402)-N(4))-methyltransferase RsmH [Bacteroidetes bacterium]|nr:16S rRNA (cytosine(1402)-N(4))-methyltransferase RsmH [Bacteroidota bacterium]